MINPETMVAKTTLRPGQKGTKRLAHQYGDRLVCVRYRYDEKAEKRYKTIELVIEEVDWTPTKPAKSNGDVSPIPPHRACGIRVEYWEDALRAEVKRAGGIWRPRHKLWELPYEVVVQLGLVDRIMTPHTDDG